MMTLQGVFPSTKKETQKNFIKENLRNLRNMQNTRSTLKNNQAIGTKKDSNITPSHLTLNKVEKPPSKSIYTSNRADMTEFLKLKQKRRGGTCQCTSKVTSNIAVQTESPIIPRSKDVACQYLELDALNISDDSSRILYPSKKVLNALRYKSNESENLDCLESYEVGTNCSIQAGRRSKKELSNATDVLLSRYIVDTGSSHNVEAPPSREKNPYLAPPSYQKGVVPKYLKEIKHKLELQRERDELNELDSNCPPGHVVVSESERIETLKILNEKFMKLVNELNQMPIRTDTLRMRNRKMQLDKELSKLEEGIKVFSRPKVYINVEG